MFASYGSSAHTFTSTAPLQPNGFKPTTGSLQKINFKDHDDCSTCAPPAKSFGEYV